MRPFSAGNGRFHILNEGSSQFIVTSYTSDFDPETDLEETQNRLDFCPNADVKPTCGFITKSSDLVNYF